MSSKKTNYFVNILNIVALITLGLLLYGNFYIRQGLIIGEHGINSMFNYGKGIVFYATNIVLLITIAHAIIVIANIICGIQNRKNKKLCFGYFLFWISTALNYFLILDDISIYSYILVACGVMAILMIFSSNRKTDGEILENGISKVLNIVLYRILYLVGILLLLGLAISSIVIVKVNMIILARESKSLFEEIYSKSGFKKSEICVPVENDYKYGFINEEGEEIIPCEYDRVTFFYKNKINSENYYYALALKNNKFYIISKDNDRAEINETLSEYLRTVFEDTEITRKDNEENYMGTRVNYISLFEVPLMVLINNGSPSYEVQTWTICDDIGDVEYIDEDDDYVYYTIDGQDYKFPVEYSVKYLKDDKMIISIESYDSETEMYSYEYEITDLDENVLYESDCIRTYDDYYLVKNENGMMVLLDKDLNEVTDEYDRIYYSADMDSAYEFSSYGDVN